MMSLAVQSLSLEPHYKMNFNLLYYVASIHQTAVSGVWCIRGFIGKGTRAHQVWSPESSTSFQSSQTRSLPSRGSECSGGKAGALTILPVRTSSRWQELGGDSDSRNYVRPSVPSASGLCSEVDPSVFSAAHNWASSFHLKYWTLETASSVVENAYWQRNQTWMWEMTSSSSSFSLRRFSRCPGWPWICPRADNDLVLLTWT